MKIIYLVSLPKKLVYASVILVVGAINTANVLAAINLSVVDHSGTAVSGFRYLVETDTTHPTTPGVRDINALSVSFHNSDAPVLAEGQTSADSASITSSQLQGGQRVFVSVLPYEGHSIGGAMATLDGNGNADVEVTVENNPIPTAQVSVQVFHDKFPINNAADGVNEQGSAVSCASAEHFCPQEFTVQIMDGGGGYGAAGPGPVSTDAFGNPLGTTYTGSINTDGTPEVQTLGNGIIHPGPDGLVVVKNLVPGKYGINIIPPSGQGWAQTHTIEGTKTVDAWIHAANPAFVNEWGPTFYHVSIGFVKEFNNIGGGGAIIQGTIVNNHLGVPPLLTAAVGAPVPNCRIGLNNANLVGVYSGRCDANSHFAIPGVPDGTYQLVVWDDALDVIISFFNVDVVGGDVTISQADGAGNIPVPNWFHTSKNVVFNDVNENGFRDPGEVGLANKTINLRFRDGRLYQTAPTDSNGEADFNEVFPFFHWLVMESDFARDKATGVTVVVDKGGDIPASSTGEFPDFGAITPQEQVCTQSQVELGICHAKGTFDYRTQKGPVLTQAFQGFLGTANAYLWGRVPYASNENGGITGIVFYSNTRAENDPRYGVGDPWEPGVARVQVALYADGDKNNLPIGGGFPGAGGEDVDWNANGTLDAPDGVIDDLNNIGGVDRADVDNFPFGWAEGGAMGPEDVDNHTDTIGDAFNKGDAISIVHTDAWDDNMPTNCQGPVFTVADSSGALHDKDCYDGLRNYNQSRPGVFDGGYALTEDASGNPLKPAKYIVEASPPRGFEIVKEEDLNVTQGDGFEPNPNLLPPACVGALHVVPAYISLHTDESGNPVVGNPEAPFYAGQTKPLCDLKQVDLQPRQNAVAEFHVFTKVPRAARVAGNVFNDVLATVDPNSPNAGEKANPAWIPVAFRDHTGKQVARVYTDEWGAFNSLLPSTWTANVPLPSGFSPMMLNACVNDSGIVPNPDYNPGAGNNLPFVQDPNYDPTLATVCWTFQYMPGSTTYLDTPTVSKGSFASTRAFPVDCEQPATTPEIAKAEGVDGGPYVQVGASRTVAQRTLTVTAVGSVQVPNPAYDGDGSPPKLIPRNYGLGAAGSGATAASIKLTNVNGVTVAAPACTTAGAVALGANVTCTWSSGTNTVRVQFGPTFPIGAYDLMLHSQGGENGKWSPTGIKVTIGNIANPLPGGGTIYHVANGDKIQNAIDAAQPYDLILVGPGMYNEQLIMDKPVRLQGSGAPSTLIFAQKTDGNMIPNWRNKVQTDIDNGLITVLPPLTGNSVTDFINEEMAGISVFGLDATVANGGFGANGANNPRIDGFTVTGADNGGGINIHGYADWLEVSNNVVKANSGNAGGGIQIGRGGLVNGVQFTNPRNNNMRIHNNIISQNGALGTGTTAIGGGVAIYNGANGYQVKENFICGNFSQGDGGGIGHEGRSNGTPNFNPTNVIEKNTVVFNQSLYFLGAYGGGVSIAGTPGLAGGLTQGSGPVLINANRIEGNNAGSGDGGGISLRFINGTDVQNNINNGHVVSLTNNSIANNVAALAGGGIVMQDAVRVNIAQNTIVNNDSTASVPAAFGADPDLSEPHPAGIVSRIHSPALDALATVTTTFSNPLSLVNNIVWHNRTFQWTGDQDNDGIPNDPGFAPNIGGGQAAVYDDFGVLPVGIGNLNPTYSIVSNTANDPGTGNATAATGSLFIRENNNGNRSGVQGTSMSTARVFDEAGAASITVDYGPLTLGSTSATIRDYHLKAGANLAVNTGTALANLPAVILGTANVLATDYDAQLRPQGATLPDKGADERYGTAPNVVKGTNRILP